MEDNGSRLSESCDYPTIALGRVFLCVCSIMVAAVVIQVAGRGGEDKNQRLRFAEFQLTTIVLDSPPTWSFH